MTKAEFGISDNNPSSMKTPSSSIHSSEVLNKYRAKIRVAYTNLRIDSSERSLQMVNITCALGNMAPNL